MTKNRLPPPDASDWPTWPPAKADADELTDVDILFAAAAQWGLEVVDLDESEPAIDPVVLARLPRDFVAMRRVVPLKIENGTLVVAVDSASTDAFADLADAAELADLPIRGVVASTEALDKILAKLAG